MHPDYQNMMMEATRLTQGGDLAAATAMIQRALGLADGNGEFSRPTAPAGRSAPPFAPDARVIDVVAREIHVPPERDTIKSPVVDPAADPVADRGQFIRGSFTHRAGAREYKLYAPPNAGARPLPLLVMLHGCTQNADDFARGTAMNEAAQRQGFYVLYPEQSQKMNPQRCWNWFKHSHQERGRGEPSMIADLTRKISADYTIDASRVYVAGLSAGGAMAAIMGETYPDVFAAVGVHSGLAAGSATDLPSALAAMQGGGKAPGMLQSGVPTIVFHGDADHTVNQRNAEQVISASIGRNASLTPRPSPQNGRRKATRRVHVDAAGKTTAEIWTVHGAPHAWSGGNPAGTYTDAQGPDATAELVRFFFDHSLRSPS